MCRILEMLRVKKYRDLSGGNISYHSEYFSHAENPELLICSTAFADKIIRGITLYTLSYQCVVNMWKYLSKKGKVPENNECRKAQVVFTDLSLFLHLFPHINHKLMKCDPSHENGPN